jgi:hypothetical protein
MPILHHESRFRSPLLCQLTYEPRLDRPDARNLDCIHFPNAFFSFATLRTSLAGRINVLQIQMYTSRDGSVGIALGYGLDDRDSRVRFPAGSGNFSPHHSVQNGSGAHPACYPMGTRGSFPGGKAAGA